MDRLSGQLAALTLAAVSPQKKPQQQQQQSGPGGAAEGGVEGEKEAAAMREQVRALALRFQRQRALNSKLLARMQVRYGLVGWGWVSLLLGTG